MSLLTWDRAPPTLVLMTAAATDLPAAPGSPSAAAVYEHLVRRGPHARTDLAAVLGLSHPTLTRLARELLENGLLRELPPRPQAKGRPQLPLDVAEEHVRLIGVKITATAVHTSVVTVRGQSLEELAAPLRRKDPDAVIATVTELCEALRSSHPRIAGVGIGLGGRVDDDGVVAPAELLGWEGPVPLRERLEQALGLPVSVRNDIHALLEGLAWFGAGRRHDSFVAITVGAGVAVGTVEGGVVRRGAGHTAGLTGALTTVTRDGRGVRLMDVACNDAVIEAGRERGVPGAGTGTPEQRLQAVLDAVRAGDPAARELAAEVGHAVAVSAAGVLGVLDPEALLLGGESVGLLRDDPAFAETLRSLLPAQQQDVVVRYLPDDFEDWARGAAVIAARRFITGTDPV